MKIEKIEGSERESLFPLRAEIWRGPLSTIEFANKDKRQYQHAFGKKITTYALKKDKEILASMDILEVKLLMRKNDKAEEEGAFLLCSCVVPENLRKNGYAKELIKQFLELRGKPVGILYSDIGPGYYEQFGFSLRKVFLVDGKAKKSSSHTITTISESEFIKKLYTIREKELLGHPEGAACLAPSEEFFSWQVDRYRYYSEIKKNTFPKATTFKVEHGNSEHLLASAPNFARNRQEGLWVTSGCVLCEEVLAQLASENSLQSYAYWDLIPPIHVREKECPMVNTGHSQSLFLDPQWIDWA